MNAIKQQIESLRPAHDRPSPWSIPNVLHSCEPFSSGSGELGEEVETTTVFLIGAECPFRCAMCDLWQYTSLERTPPGAIPFQLSQVLSRKATGKRQWLKLYNASNFFDERSVPKQDLAEIAKHCALFERVIVENHPRFCDDRMLWFSQNIAGQLEVALGLETIHPNAMKAMNKGMTLDDFDTAIEHCKRLKIDVRVFVLLHPPGIEMDESVDWTCKTVNYALQRNVRHISVIPVRAGNGWIDKLVDSGEYQVPKISLVRELFQKIGKHHWRIPVGTCIEFDLWGWDQIEGGCPRCRMVLKEHILQCHHTQSFLPLEENLIDCECPL